MLRSKKYQNSVRCMVLFPGSYFTVPMTSNICSLLSLGTTTEQMICWSERISFSTIPVTSVYYLCALLSQRLSETCEWLNNLSEMWSVRLHSAILMQLLWFFYLKYCFSTWSFCFPVGSSFLLNPLDFHSILVVATALKTLHSKLSVEFSNLHEKVRILFKIQ